MRAAPLVGSKSNARSKNSIARELPSPFRWAAPNKAKYSLDSRQAGIKPINCSANSTQAPSLCSNDENRSI